MCLQEVEGENTEDTGRVMWEAEGTTGAGAAAGGILEAGAGASLGAGVVEEETLTEGVGAGGTSAVGAEGTLAAGEGAAEEE